MRRYNTETQTTPMATKIAHTYLKRLGFVGFINRNVTWDEKQVKLTPGQLALSVVLSTFGSSRYPLSRIPQHFLSMNTEMLFGKGVTAEDISDDAIARTLDKIYDAGADSLYSKLALTAFTTFDISLGNLHSDTSSHVFFGEYADCQESEYDGVSITYGFSKEHRPDLKQIMVGNIVNSDGIPLVHRTLDGNTSDCRWNQDAIDALAELIPKQIRDVVYIADAKLVTEPNLRLLHKNQMRFISRVPDSFCSKLTSRVKKEAYENRAWQDLGGIVNDKKHASYQGISHTRYLGMEKVRLLVVKSSAGRDGFEARIQKERDELERKVRDIARQEFACEPDAAVAAEAFKKQHSKRFYSLSYTLSLTTIQKRPVGHPGKTPKPPVEVNRWHIEFQIIEKDGMIQSAQEQAESFVLVTNIPVEEMDDCTLLRRYKEQHVVEKGFRWLRQPSMASTIFLKKPGRIVALMMLIHVALMIRALMQREARKRVRAMPEAPRIDLDGKKVDNPTADKILILLINHGIITDHGEHYYTRCRDKDFERLQVLLQLLGIDEEELLTMG